MGELEAFPGFVSIGFYARLIENRLRNQMQLIECENERNNDTDANADKGDNAKQHPDERARYVEQRLRDVAAFEERASGHVRKSRLR